MKISSKEVLCPSNIGISNRLYQDILIQIIPEKYEILYDRLHELIERYYTISSYIEYENDNYNDYSEKIKLLNEELIENIKTYKEIEKKIKKIDTIIPNLEISESYSEIANLNDKKIQLIKKLNKIIEKIDVIKFETTKNINNYNKTRDELSLQEYELKNVVENIKVCLNEIDEIKIKKIDNNGNFLEKERYENFEVRPEHIKTINLMIDKLFENNSEETNRKIKIDIITSITTYLNFRKQEIKIEKKDANQIVEAYKERKILPLDNNIYSFQNIVTSILYDDNLDSLLGNELCSVLYFGVPSEKNKLENINKALDVIIELMKKYNSNNFDKSCFEESLKQLDKIDFYDFVDCKNKLSAELFKIKQKKMNSF